MLNLYKEISQKNENSTIEDEVINKEIVEELEKDLK